jgi:hypothetical protein
MITFHGVFKYKRPYRPKLYRPVVKLNGGVRDLHRQFRTHSRAEVYAHAVIQRYERVLFAAQLTDGQSVGASGNNTERMPV